MNPALSQDVETKLAPSSIEGFKMLNPRTDKELPALLGSFALRESSVDVPYTITKLDEISIYPEKNEAYSKPFGRIRRGSTLDDGYFIIENFGFDKIVEKPNGFKDFIYEKDNLNFNIEIENESEPMFTKFPDIRETPMAIQPDTAKEAQARQFRRGKLRFGPLGEFVGQIPTNPKIRSVVGTLLSVRDRLTRGTFVAGESHRDLAALFSGLMTGSDEIRSTTMDKLDESVQAESDALKAEAEQSRNESLDYDGLSADVLIVGAGIHGSVAAARLRAERPDARIIVIDQEDTIGGQFRKYGQRPTFFINSRNHRPESTRTGLPGSDGNLNPFGKKAPVQITDIATETYPTNVDLGNVAAINLYLSAEMMTGVRVTEMDTDVYGQNQQVTLFDEKEQRFYTVSCQQVVMATGLGERKLSSDRAPNHWTAEDLLSHFGNPDNSFPMDAFVGKRIAIVGGGDTGRVCAELFARLGPADAYGSSVSQLGGPERIVWFGTDFADREEYCASNRPRYQRLASFITDKFGLSSQFLINPMAEKVSDVGQEDGSNALYVDYGVAQRDSGFDYVIDARTLPDAQAEANELVGSDFDAVIKEYLPDRIKTNKVVAGLRQPGRLVYLVGPPAQAQLDVDEQRRFASGIKENTVSIWANTPRTEAIALEVANRLR